MSENENFYSFSATKNNGETISMEIFRGKTVLCVNTASRCGYTPQYEGLEQLYQKLKDRNFVVLAFPCNQFGGQEPGTDAEIAEFCDTRFHVTFPLFQKIAVRGKDVHPLFQYLKKETKGVFGTESIKWNFTKFLIDKEGRPVTRFGSKDKPEDLEKKILEIL